VNSPPSLKQTPAQRRGAWAEALAKQALCAQGLCFVAQNIRCRVGEIDLIFWEGPVLVFVEVRYRQKSRFGRALDTIRHAKQRRIRCAALWWLQRNHKGGLPPCRFDVYALDGDELCWVKGAFSA
jgi:putative endonuclease